MIRPPRMVTLQPTAPRTLVHRLPRGHGRLRVASVAGDRSAGLHAAGADPLALLVTRARGPAVWAYTTTMGGGLLAGDEIQLEVNVEREATCFLGTQASTKVYPSHGPTSRQA